MQRSRLSGKKGSAVSASSTRSLLSLRPTNFQEWLQTINNGQKTTLEQQVELAVWLYNQTTGRGGKMTQDNGAATARQIIWQLEHTPIRSVDSLVTWKGIHVNWFLTVFCQSPYLKKLQEFGCELWFVRKVAVIEIVRRATQSQSKDKPVSGPFIDHIDAVVQDWGLERKSAASTNGRAIVCKPTTFVSYTGAYTLDHVLDVLEQLDPEEYIWMDIFCVDQFAWTGKGRSEEMTRFRDAFIDDLEQQIKAIKNVALVLEKWDDAMVTLGQIWVLWEIFNAAEAQAQLRVLLSLGETHRFIGTCLESTAKFSTILASLASVDASQALADNDGDRVAIKARMRAIGWQNVNTLVVGVLRAWLAASGQSHLDSQKATPEGPSTVLLNNLGLLYRDQGKFDDAAPLFRQALEKQRRDNKDSSDSETLNVMNNLAATLKDQGKFDDAEPLAREVLHRHQQESSGGDSNNKAFILLSINNLSMVLKEQGKVREAEALLRQALDGQRRELGDLHPNTLTTLNNLAALLNDSSREDEALPLMEEALSGTRKEFGDLHPTTLNLVNNLAMLLRRQGKVQEVEPLLREALAGYRQQLGDLHPSTLLAANNVGLALRDQGRLTEAEPYFREAVKGERQVLGNLHPSTLLSINHLGMVLREQGRFQEAEPYFYEALNGYRQELGNLHPATLISIRHLADLLRDEGKLSESEPLCREVLQGQKKVLGGLDVMTLVSVHSLGAVLYVMGMQSANITERQQRLHESRSLLREAVAGLTTTLGKDHPNTKIVSDNLTQWFGS